MGRGVTRGVASSPRPATTLTRRERNQASENRAQRARYVVEPQDDGGAWRGPTDAAWTARILHGARPPRASTGMLGNGTVPHG